MDNEIKDDICPYCGHRRRYALYVVAHWRELFIGTCESCGKKYKTQMGHISKMRQPKAAVNG